MTEFGPSIAASVHTRCHASAAKAAVAFTHAFGGEFLVVPGDSTTLNRATAPPELAGPGLLCALKVSDSAALLLLPESSGLLPPWYAAPDASGASKLYTLAQELGKVFLPEEFAPGDVQAARVDDLAAAQSQAGVAEGAGVVSFTVISGEHRGTLWLVWPAEQSANAFFVATSILGHPVVDQSPPQDAAQSSVPPSDARLAQRILRYRDLEDGLKLLPAYTRSLLRIKVPAVVTLAETKQPIGKILELVPGAIIQFKKSCEEMLTLHVGGQGVALGEAVKVGDKFGLRITSIRLPDERFLPVRTRR